MKAVSSSGLAAPQTWRSARSRVASIPETNEAMWKAWTPISGGGEGWAGGGRIDPPILALAIGGDRRDRPVLAELDEDLTNAAELPGPHHFPRLANHGKGGKAVGHAEEEAGRLLPTDEVDSIGEIGRQRLVANDVDTAVEEGGAHRVMRDIRRGYRDGIDTVRASRLGCRHFPVIAVDAVSRKVPIRARRASLLGIGRERAGDNLPPSGQAGTVGVERGNETTADHAKTKPTMRGIGRRRMREVGSHNTKTDALTSTGASRNLRNPARSEDCLHEIGNFQAGLHFGF